MVLDYKKLKAEFEEIKKKENKLKKFGEKYIDRKDTNLFDLNLEEENSEEAKKQKYWEYLAKQLA